jgi:hypothetical protein
MNTEDALTAQVLNLQTIERPYSKAGGLAMWVPRDEVLSILAGVRAAHQEQRNMEGFAGLPEDQQPSNLPRTQQELQEKYDALTGEKFSDRVQR